MKMSAEGRRKLTIREGVRLKAYKDSVGVWTIGVGHTSAAGDPKVTPGLTITQAECDEIFARDLVQYERAVDKAVKVPLSQKQFDALVSLCFNIGTGGFARSSVVKRLNAGDTVGAADAFLLWNKPPEIMGRRRGERKQFLEGGPAVKPEPAPDPQPEPRQPDDPGPERQEDEEEPKRKKTWRTETGSIGSLIPGADALSTANDVITQVNETKDNAKDLGVFDYLGALATNPRFMIPFGIFVALIGGVIWWQVVKRRR